MVGRQADVVMLTAEERKFLEAQVRRHKTPRSLSDRCRMILLCEEGLQSKEVAERLGVHEHTVGKWRRRFVKNRAQGLIPRRNDQDPCAHCRMPMDMMRHG
jgi:DNA-binding CsgD family transcriptional regulator